MGRPERNAKKKLYQIFIPIAKKETNTEKGIPRTRRSMIPAILRIPNPAGISVSAAGLFIAEDSVDRVKVSRPKRTGSVYAAISFRRQKKQAIAKNKSQSGAGGVGPENTRCKVETRSLRGTIGSGKCGVSAHARQDSMLLLQLPEPAINRKSPLSIEATACLLR